MAATYKTTQRWRYKARRWLTRYAGGECQCCGYDAYIGNLTFHHLRDKIIAVSRLINATASWDRLLEEANKCVLVCQNCHGEIHAGLRDSPTVNLEKRRTTLVRILAEQPIPKNRQYHNCICGNRINRNLKFCSHKCHHRSLEATKWPDNLPDLVRRSSKRAMAVKLGVSDKAVAKRLHNHHKEPVAGLEPAVG